MTLDAVQPLEPRRLLASATAADADRFVPGGFAATVNFQPADAGQLDGRADFGRPFALRGNGLTYGWGDAQTTFDRDADPAIEGVDLGDKFDTGVAVAPGDSWTIEVPDADATYAVLVVAGDPATPGYSDWSVNGLPLISGQPRQGYPFAESYAYVTPDDDGRITLTAGPLSDDDALLWVRVAEATPLPTAAQGEPIDWTITDDIESPVTRAEGGVARVGDDVVFVGGFPSGYETTYDRVDVLDVNTGTFSAGTPLPDAAAENHAAAASDGEYVYWVAGHSEDFAEPLSGDPAEAVRFTTTAWRYDVAAEVWEQLPDLPAPRGAAMAVVAGNRLHVMGGTDATNIIAQRDHWSLDLAGLGDPLATPAWEVMPPLPVGTDHAVAGVFEGAGTGGGPLIVVAGGEYAHGVSYAVLEHTQIYDVNTAEWRFGTAMPAPISHANAVVSGGRLWLVGGQEQGQVVRPNALSYDVDADRWLRHTDLPEDRKIGGLYAVEDDLDDLPTLFYLAGDMYQDFWSTETIVGEVGDDLS